MVEIAKENDIKICKVPSDWFPTCFYSTELHTIFINQFLSSEEQSRMISCLLDRLGILTPPPIIFMYRYKGEFLSNTLEAATNQIN